MLDYDPFSPAAMSDPHPIYRRLRAESPIHPLPRYDGFALARFAEVWEVIQDSRRFTLAEGPVYFPGAVARPARLPELLPWEPLRSFSSWDPPPHTRIRAELRAALGPASVAALEGALRALAREHLERFAASGRGDLVRDYAAPVSVAGICTLLGLPLEDAPEYCALGNRASRRAPRRAGMTPAGLEAQRELFERVLAVVRRQRAAGVGKGRHALDALLWAEIEGRRLDDAAVATQLVTLLVGGSETLPKLLAGGARELARHPEQRAALVREPEQIPAAFEEIVRHQGVLQAVGRTATRDLAIGGVRVRAGQRLFLLLQSANRDALEFEDPDRFEIRRRPRRHLGFGHGTHHCIGAHLARLEGRVLLEELLHRIPEWEVEEASCERLPSEFQIGFTALPIRFPPLPAG